MNILQNLNILQNPNQLILPLATAIGAWGGFPEPPQLFKKLAKIELFQYLMVAILIWQSGNESNIVKALILAGLMFGIKMGLNMLKL